jgi:hypothetical protein
MNILTHKTHTIPEENSLNQVLKILTQKSNAGTKRSPLQLYESHSHKNSFTLDPKTSPLAAQNRNFQTFQYSQRPYPSSNSGSQTTQILKNLKPNPAYSTATASSPPNEKILLRNHSHHKSTILDYKQEKFSNANKSQSFGLGFNSESWKIGPKIGNWSFEVGKSCVLGENGFLGNLYPEFGGSSGGFGSGRDSKIVGRSQVGESPKKVVDSAERGFLVDELTVLKEKACRLESRKSELQGKLDRGVMALESAKALQKKSLQRPCPENCNSNCEKTVFFIEKLKQADKCIRNLVSANDKLFTEFNELKLQRIKHKQSISPACNQISNQLSKQSSFAASNYQNPPKPTPDAKHEIQKLKSTINLLETNIATQYSEIKNFKSLTPEK